MKRFFVSALVVLTVFLTSSSAMAEEDPWFIGDAEDETLNVRGIGKQYGVTISDGSNETSAATQAAVSTAYEEASVDCMIRLDSYDPSRSQDLAEERGCTPGDGPTTAEIVTEVSSAFRTLNLTPPPIVHQPETDWALVNIDFIVYTDAQTQTLDTAIFGVPITIQATPVHYSWDFGDGSPPLATTDQGQPYPNQTVAHVYTSSADAVAVTLTTSWQGRFMIGDSGIWLPIAGFATTTSTAPSVEIVAMEVNLVPNP